MKKYQLKKKYKKMLFTFGFLLCLGIFFYSIGKVFLGVYSDHQSKKTYTTLYEQVHIPKIEDSTDEVRFNFTALESINPDIVGWILIPDTQISYPVVQAKDNSYYLRKDIYKKYNQNGSIFMHYLNHNDFSDANTILFGHNNHRDSSMFGDLKRLYDEGKKQGVEIYMYTKEKTLIYETYLAYITDPNDANPLDIHKESFKDNIEFKQTLTLSTCYQNSKERIIFHAYLKESKPVI